MQLMRPGIGRNASCASGDLLTSSPKGCSQPKELWFFDILMYIHVYVQANVDKSRGSHHECLQEGMESRTSSVTTTMMTLL